MRCAQRFWNAALVVLMLAAGTGMSLVLKAMSVHNPVPKCAVCLPEPYNSPFMQSVFMFLGEALCLLAFSCRPKLPQPQKAQKHFKACPHSVYPLIPAAADAVGATLYFFGLYYSSAAVYQMIRSLVFVFTGAISFIAWRDFRKAFDLPQGTALLVLAGGIATISCASILFPGDPEDGTARDPVLGVAFTIGGTLFGSLIGLGSEFIARRVAAPPSLVVGLEGVWGLAIFAVALPVLNVIPSPFSPDGPDPGSRHVLEDIPGWAYQVTAAPLLLGYHFIFAALAFGYNLLAYAVVQRQSATAYATYECLRTLLVWASSWALGWEAYDGVGTPMTIAGFIVLAVGVLAYNGAFQITPYCKPANIAERGRWGRRKTLPTEEGSLLAEGDTEPSPAE